MFNKKSKIIKEQDRLIDVLSEIIISLENDIASVREESFKASIKEEPKTKAKRKTTAKKAAKK